MWRPSAAVRDICARCWDFVGGVHTWSLHVPLLSSCAVIWLAAFTYPWEECWGALKLPFSREQGTGVTHSVQAPGWRITITWGSNLGQNSLKNWGREVMGYFLPLKPRSVASISSSGWKCWPRAIWAVHSRPGSLLSQPGSYGYQCQGESGHTTYSRLPPPHPFSLQRQHLGFLFRGSEGSSDIQADVRRCSGGFCEPLRSPTHPLKNLWPLSQNFMTSRTSWQMRLQAHSCTRLSFITANSDWQLLGTPESQQAARKTSWRRWSVDLKLRGC